MTILYSQKNEIIDEISPQKDKFRDTDQIYQLIAKAARAINWQEPLNWGFSYISGALVAKINTLDHIEEQMINASTYLDTLKKE